MADKWEWGSRGGVGAGLVAAAAAAVLGASAQNLFAVLAILVAGGLFFRVVRGWPSHSRRHAFMRRTGLWAVVILTIACASYPTSGILGLRHGEEPISETVKSAVRQEFKRVAPPVAAPIPMEPIREAAKEGARDGAKQGAQESAKEQREEKLKQEGNPQGMAFAQGRPLVPNVSYTSEAAVGRADAPYGLKVVIQTQAPVPRVLLKMMFTAPIRSASFSYMMQVAPGISSEVSENKTIFWKDNVLDFGFTSPVFSPDRPIVLFVYSAAPIAAKSLELVPR